MSLKDKVILNSTEICLMFGIHPNTLCVWEKKGFPVRKVPFSKHKMYFMDEVTEYIKTGKITKKRK